MVTPLPPIPLDPDAPPRLTLAPGEVHVWCLFADRFEDPALLARLGALMTDDERARQARFVRARDRHLQGLARALVRVLFSAYADETPDVWRFGLGPHGKPFLAAPALTPPLSFNLSHTEGLVAAAFTVRDEVGVDVEDLSRRAPTIDVARRFFAPAEVARLEAETPEGRTEAFFAFWTLKEAYLKARGVGLSLPLASFAFDLDAEPPAVRFVPPIDDDPSRWRFLRQTPSGHHRLALAVSRPPGAPCHVRVGEVLPPEALR